MYGLTTKGGRREALRPGGTTMKSFATTIGLVLDVIAALLLIGFGNVIFCLVDTHAAITRAGEN